jgi:hypothetical protein
VPLCDPAEEEEHQEDEHGDDENTLNTHGPSVARHGTCQTRSGRWYLVRYESFTVGVIAALSG